jgi:cation diffusion facilitator CzcD-associated flavoprotein CzcO
MSEIRSVRQRTGAPRQDEGPSVHPNPLRPARHGLPGPPDTYPGKDAVAGYLKAYAAAFNLPVRQNARVARLGQTAEGFEIRTQDEVLRARQVVVATRPFQVPSRRRPPRDWTVR